jgi:hypothetical protein
MTEHPLNAEWEIVDAANGLLSINPKRTKLAIVGGMPLRRELPINEPDVEIWSCNLIQTIDHEGQLRADRWFELHPMSVQNDNDMQWIHENPRPLYTLEHEPDLPNTLKFPMDKIEAMGFANYFSCTFAYQIALAMVEGFTEIGLYGVDLIYGTDREREVELPCVTYWLGLFQGSGGKLVLPEHSSALHHRYRYGFDYWEEKRWVERRVRNLNLERVEHLQNVLGIEAADAYMERMTTT